jgi:predicted ester cyclase
MVLLCNGSGGKTMSLEENKTLVRRYFEDAPYDPDICDEIFAPRFLFSTIQRVGVTDQAAISTPREERAYYHWLDTVWGEWRMTVDEIIAEDERVMVCWTFYGTHQSEYYGLPATGIEVTYSGVNIFRIEDGKIIEVRDISDRLWLWQQLGVLPEIKEAIARAKKK